MEVNLNDYIGLARSIANKIGYKTVRHSYEIEDCVGEAFLGLCKARDKFDPSKGAFSTIATHKITGEVKSALREKDSHIKITRNMIKEGDYPETLSLDVMLAPDDVGIRESYQDFLADPSDEYEKADLRLTVQHLVSKMPKQYRELLEGVMAGENSLETHDRLKPDRKPHVTWAMHLKAREMMKDILIQEGLDVTI